jgi:hypothetical protein
MSTVVLVYSEYDIDSYCNLLMLAYCVSIQYDHVITFSSVLYCDFSAFISIPNTFPALNKYKYYSFYVYLDATERFVFADKSEF